jgi:tetratricopeptide (TPR) repeat protein/DNA-binding CsgD family transcriptional regulator
MILKRLVTLLFLFYFVQIPFLKAQTESDSLRQYLSIIEDGYQRVDLYLQISTSFKTTNIDSAIHYAESARRVALFEENDKGVAESLFILGKIDLRRDSLFEAREHFYQALDYTDDCACDSLVAAIYLFLGKTYTLHDNYSEAIVNFLKSRELAEKIDDKVLLSDLFDDIGLVFILLDNYEQAEGYFKKSLEVNELIDNKKSYANSLRNIGLIYQKKNQFTEAEKMYMEALDIYRELNHLPGISTSNIGIGNTKFGLKNYDAALTYYKTALDFAEKIKISSKGSGPFIMALCYNRLGETYLRLKRYDDALEMLRLSSDLSEKFMFPGRKADASLFYSQVYEQIGNIVLAFDYYKNYNQLSDSIINARNVSVITRLQLEYQFLKEQKERELEETRKEEAYKRKIMLYKSIGTFSLIAFILLLFILILYRKNERNKRNQAELNEKNLQLEKENLQKELEYKNKELTTNVMYQLRKNNFIKSTSEKLKTILQSAKADNKKLIQEVVKELDGNMSKGSWEEFEFRFNEVHTDFYNHLVKDFPDLTPNELRLSAFLKLNMTTKDIATITYQTPHSITVARHRLRTKLGLQRDDNLVSFLSRY